MRALVSRFAVNFEWAAERLTKRVADAVDAIEGVVAWVDEIFAFVRTPRRAERVAVLGSIAASRAEGAEVVAVEGRRLLVVPLLDAVRAGQADGSFTVDDPELASELVAAAVLLAAGLTAPFERAIRFDQAGTTAFCLRALGARRS